MFRLGSGASSLPGQPFLVRIQTPYQEPHTTTAFEPTSAMTGSTTQSASNIPIPAPEPNLTGALRGTRNNHSLFQYSSDLHAGTKELDIFTKDNITVTADYQRAQCKCHYSELCNQYQDLFFALPGLVFSLPGIILSFKSLLGSKRPKVPRIQRTILGNHQSAKS